MIKKALLFFMFVLFSMPVYAKAKLKVYPNPWIPESGKSLVTDKGDKMRHGAYTADGWIKFKGVNSKNNSDCHGTLEIYDITGHLVKFKRWTIEDESKIPLPQTCDELKPDEEFGGTNLSHIVHWDGKDNNYEYVESGVYIWIIEENDGQKHDGKVVVIR